MSEWPVLEQPVASPHVPTLQTRLRSWQKAVRRPSAENDLFLLLSPLGLAGQEALRAGLARLGIRVLARQPVPCFSEVVNAVYARRSTRQAALRALVYAQAWRELAGAQADVGEVWWLSPRTLHPVLAAAKSSLRPPEVTFWLRHGSEHRRASLHAFHVPDVDDLDFEVARLRAALRWAA